MTPAPSTYHQTLSRRLQFLFYRLELEEKGLIFDAPVDLLIPDAQPAQPDLIYLRPDQESLVTRRGIEGVPELVVEILSPTTATTDRTVKLQLYEGCGVNRYLLLDPVSRTLEIFRLDGYHPLVRIHQVWGETACLCRACLEKELEPETEL